MILSCNHISKSFGEDVILDDCSFFVNEYEKVAIVGNNGAGKSTLLKIIMNELSADNGEVIISKDTSVGYLAQHQDTEGDNTIYKEVESVKQYIIDMENELRKLENLMGVLTGDELHNVIEKHNKLEQKFKDLNGYAYKSEIEGVLKGLGFNEADFNKPVKNLSGGQKTRVALCKLLVEKPDIIILDEPTNHLDLNSISWLETYLLNYKGTVIIIAHDRYFLDKIVNKVVEISNAHCHTYNGNYSDFSMKKAKMRDDLMKAYLKQQNKLKHEQEVIDKLYSYRQEKFYKRAQSRMKQLENMEKIDKPEEISAKMNITLTPKISSGNDVLSVEGLSKSFDSLTLFSDISFEIKRLEHVALIGDNGTGKTTILKIINGLVDADSGVIKLGTNVKIGYYDQEHHNLSDDNTIFDEIALAYPDLTNTKIRNTLAAFMFTGDDVFKKISELSGGEKGRVSLAKLMLSEANFIILDEPTNHLDMTSREILEDALNNYEGTILYVSHDRYFINRTASRIIELTNHILINYLGDFDYYEEKKDELNKRFVTETKSSIEKTKTSNKEDFKLRKARKNEIKKLENTLKSIEEEISKKEALVESLNDDMNNPDYATNSAKLSEIHNRITETEESLMELMAKWEEVSNTLSKY